jgi:hypothetical protein
MFYNIGPEKSWLEKLPNGTLVGSVASVSIAQPESPNIKLPRNL